MRIKALQLTRLSVLQSSLVACGQGIGSRERDVPAGRQLSARSLGRQEKLPCSIPSARCARTDAGTC
jgi:hypothetical protein